MKELHNRSRTDPLEDIEHSDYIIQQMRLQLLSLSHNKANNLKRAHLLAQLATIYWRLNKTDEAVHMWKQVMSIAEEEDDDTLWIITSMGLATIHGQCGNVEEALKYSRLAVVKDPENPDAMFTLGNCYRDAGDDDSALEWWQRTLEKDDKFPLVYESMAAIYVQRREYEKAQTYFEMSVKLNASPESAFHGLGNMRMTQGRYQEALAYYKKAARANPKDGLSHNNIGNCYLRMGNMDKARRSYERSIKINPDEALWANVGMGLIYRSLPSPKARAKSATFFERALEIYHDGRARLKSGRLEHDTRYAMSLTGLGDVRAVEAWRTILEEPDPTPLGYGSVIDCMASVNVLVNGEDPPPHLDEILALLEQARQRHESDFS